LWGLSFRCVAAGGAQRPLVWGGRPGRWAGCVMGGQTVEPASASAAPLAATRGREALEWPPTCSVTTSDGGPTHVVAVHSRWLEITLPLELGPRTRRTSQIAPHANATAILLRSLLFPLTADLVGVTGHVFLGWSVALSCYRLRSCARRACKLRPLRLSESNHRNASWCPATQFKKRRHVPVAGRLIEIPGLSPRGQRRGGVAANPRGKSPTGGEPRPATGGAVSSCSNPVSPLCAVSG